MIIFKFVLTPFEESVIFWGESKTGRGPETINNEQV